MEDDFVELALGSDTVDEGKSGQAQGAAAAAAGTPSPATAAKPAGETGAAKEPPAEDGTAKPDGQASPAGKEEAKGVLPQELEPYKDLIESRKWDLTKPADVAALAKAYKEVEQHASRSQTHGKNAQDKASRIVSIAGGSVEDLNKWRKSQGLSEIKSETRSHEDQEKEAQELFDHVDKALSGDKESLKWLNGHFNKRFQDLAVDKRLAQQSPGKSAEQAFQERKKVSQTNFAAVVMANPQAKVYFDELTEHLSPGGVFDSLGIDVLDAASTPERLAAFVELGQAVNTFRNIEKVVEERVTAELERRRLAGNAGGEGSGSRGGKQATPKESDQVADFTNLFT